jgi:hypothetical protein
VALTAERRCDDEPRQLGLIQVAVLPELPVADEQ